MRNSHFQEKAQRGFLENSAIHDFEKVQHEFDMNFAKICLQAENHKTRAIKVFDAVVEEALGEDKNNWSSFLMNEGLC